MTEPTVTEMAAGGFGSTLGSWPQDRRRRTPGKIRESRIKKEKTREGMESARGWVLKKFTLCSQGEKIHLPEYFPPTA